MKEVKNVKIRIAVAVDSDGSWNAVGWSGENDPPTDGDMMESAIEELVRGGENRYFVEIEVGLPMLGIKTVQGKVLREQ